MSLAIERKRSLQDRRTEDFAPEAYKPPHKPFGLELRAERFTPSAFATMLWRDKPLGKYVVDYTDKIMDGYARENREMGKEKGIKATHRQARLAARLSCFMLTMADKHLVYRFTQER